MVAAAEVPVCAVHGLDLHACKVITCYVDCEAAELACWRVILAADGEALCCSCGGLIRWDALGEEADDVALVLTIIADWRPDNIVRPHSLDVGGGVGEGLSEIR